MYAWEKWRNLKESSCKGLWLSVLNPKDQLQASSIRAVGVSLKKAIAAVSDVVPLIIVLANFTVRIPPRKDRSSKRGATM